MTVNTTNITSGPYNGNDVADTFSYTFRVQDKNQLTVYETDDAGIQTQLTVDTDYTVAGIGDDNGGTVTRVAGALPTGYQWYIRSNYQPTQLTAFESQGAFFPDLHEDAMDKLTFLIQQLLDLSGDRSFRLSETLELDGNFALSEDADARKGFFLGFDGSGDIAILPATGEGVVPLQQARQTGDGSTTQFNTPATTHVVPLSLMVYVDGVRQRPDTDYTTGPGAIGKVTFTTAPLDGVSIDIVYYEPNTLNPGGFVEEAPVDGNQYARKDAGWEQVAAVLTFLGLTDSPSSYTGQAGKAVVVKGTEDGVEFGDAAGAGRSINTANTGTLTAATTWVIDTTAVRNRDLPLNPSDGDEVGFVDEDGLAATNNATIGRNGKTIAGAASDLVVNVNFAKGVLKYNDADGDWKLVP